MQEPRRIALTGATGHLGRRVLMDLLDAGYSGIRCLSRKPQTPLSGVLWFQGDLSDPFILDDLVEGTDTVIHAASLESYSPLDVPKLFRTNTEGTANVVNACLHAGTAHLIHISSTAAIGRPPNIRMIDEGTEWVKSPYHTQYAESRYKAELEVFRGQEEGLGISIVNPALLLDPAGQAPHTRVFLDRIRRRERSYPTGSNGFIDIRDVSRCLLAHLDRQPSGQRLILSAANWSYRELLEALATAAGLPAPDRPLTGFGALWQTLLGRLTLGPSLFRAERMLAFLEVGYDNTSCREHFGFVFTPIAQTVADVAKALKATPAG